LAIPAAPAAMPPNPNIAAIMAIIRNVIVQPNITKYLKVRKCNNTFKNSESVPKQTGGECTHHTIVPSFLVVRLQFVHLPTVEVY